jgi:alkanesulfonate monooxygenase SsuD/methylene tetrahydromethanopterin reductase-like flavin-dependent oxidoreductase (luciferase family)
MAVTGPDAAARLDAEARASGLDAGVEHGVAGDADAVAAGVRRWADAGADAVVLQPLADDDPVRFARFVGGQVRPRIG